MEKYLIEGKEKGPRVLISAGVHGDEYEPMVACWRIIYQLREKLIAGKVTVCPVVNTNAFLNAKRVGTDGLDLARICPGNREGSVTETAAAQISNLISQTDYYIDLHTGGSVLDIIPLTGYMLHTSKEVLASQQMMAKAFNLPVVWGTDYKPNGRTLSIARDHNIPAIYAEYGGGKRIREKVIEAYIKGCLNILKKLGMVMMQKGATPKWEYWIEDHTPDSGFLQDKLPSPVRGIFIPEVKLGERVQKGQRWGITIDPLSGAEINVEADKDGMVMMLRVAPFVNAGESLGSILPVTKPGKLIINVQ